MSHYRLTHTAHTTTSLTSSAHDQMRLALAIADADALKSLLVDCTPALAVPQRIQDIQITVSVPMKGHSVIDGLIQVDEVYCRLIDDPGQCGGYGDRSFGYPSGRIGDVMRCESELQTLGTALSVAQAIALLAKSGFAPSQIDEILRLPGEAWHKSWWATVDAVGKPAVPFLRTIRTVRYYDGTVALQYKDYFPQDKPPCFTSDRRQVIVAIEPSIHRFSKTLEKINLCREHCQVKTVVLICNSISDLEAQGFMNQGISIYATQDLRFPVPAHCSVCANVNCPMHGQPNSPVITCGQFRINGSWA